MTGRGRPKGGSKYEDRVLVQFSIEREEKEIWQKIADEKEKTLSDFIKEKVLIGLALEEIADLKLNYYAKQKKEKTEKNAVWFVNRILDSPNIQRLLMDGVFDMKESDIQKMIEQVEKEALEEASILIQKRLQELEKK